MTWYEKLSWKHYLLIGIGIIILQIGVLSWQGHIPICSCGHVRLWYGALNSPEDSQQISDWYTFSHIIHGFLFFWLLGLATKKKWPWEFYLVLAIAIEVGWEILENSPLIINRYRETASLMYYGDSILNSVSDVVAMILGFILASRLRVWISVALVISMELFTLYMIRDNLTLNILMLIQPFEVIKNWQLGI